MGGFCKSKNCVTCGKEFRSRKSSQVFCSRTCVKGVGKSMGSCRVCGKTFIGKSHKTCCSKTCIKRVIWMRTKYGTTPEIYRAMYESQQGLCAICRKRPVEDIDHNHFTREVRSLLCSGCNCGLGNFSESIEFLKNAIDYLEKFNAHS